MDVSHSRSHSRFSRLGQRTARIAGNFFTFLAALGIVAVWAISGPYFGYSDTWQLVINTGTTIVTFLMVFLIQNSQNRDTVAIQLKLDELIRATQTAHNAVIDLDELDDEDLDRLLTKYRSLARRASGQESPVCGDSDESGAAAG